MREDNPCAQLSNEITPNNSFNVCAVTIGNGRHRLLLLAVYRPNWATTANTEELCDMINQYAISYNSIIMVGDFKFTGICWHGAGACVDTLCESIFCNLIHKHQL